MGLFQGKRQYKAAHHVHSTNSTGDGKNNLSSVIEDHYRRGYDILSITDHNRITRNWVDPGPTTSSSGLMPARLSEMASGVDRDGRPMLMIPNTIEQSQRTGQQEHICTLLMDSDTPDLWQTPREVLREVKESKSLAHINHIGRTLRNLGGTIGGTGRAERYIEFIEDYGSDGDGGCVGIEIINSPTRYWRYDLDIRYCDRFMWDNMNRILIPNGKYAWGFTNDDTHEFAETGYAWNVMVMPQNTLEEFKKAMHSGSFYGVTRIAPYEGVNVDVANDRVELDQRLLTPVVRDIEVSGPHITINAEHYIRIEWITSTALGGTRTVHTGEVIDVGVGDIGGFVRANVIGIGGVAFVRPFRVQAGTVYV